MDNEGETKAVQTRFYFQTFKVEIMIGHRIIIDCLTLIIFKDAKLIYFVNKKKGLAFLFLRCQWNKKWFPYADTLPTCYITDCVKPFIIPEDSFIKVCNLVIKIDVKLNI